MDFERIRNFILSYTSDSGGVLYNIRNKAEEDGVPIIRRDTEEFLKVILKMTEPHELLEIGTAVGYSSIFFCDVLSAVYQIIDKEDDDNFDKGISINDEITKWHIDTCELDKDRILAARDNISKAGYDDIIIIHEGDAVDTLTALIEQKKVYDFIFIDAAKAQYMNYIELSLKLSHKGTVIVTDNIFGDGDILESHYLVEKRDRTIHDRMREYIYHITHTEKLDTSIIPVGDGIALSIVK